MKKVKFFTVTALFLAIFVGSSSIALAQTSSSTQSLTNQIQLLLQQVKTLQDKISALDNQKSQLKTELKQTMRLTRSLSLGMTSDDVKLLQQMLATDSSIYPEGLITGYFGALTEKAVRKFQAKHGIEQAGKVGPKTLAKINALLKEGKLSYDPDKKMIVASTTALSISDKKITLCHKTGNHQQTINVSVSALYAHIAHGDFIGVCSSTTNGATTTPATTTPDTIAPTINNLASSTASTTSYISWTTNESATSTLWYSTVTPVNASTATKAEDNTWKTNHSYNITGLTSSTTYYYVVRVSDAVGNMTTSAEKLFTTLGN